MKIIKYNAKKCKSLSIIRSIELRVLFLHSPSHAIVASGYPYVIVSKCKKMQNTLDNSNVELRVLFLHSPYVIDRIVPRHAYVRVRHRSLFFVACIHTYVRSNTKNAKNAKIIFCIFCISFIFSFPTLPTRPQLFYIPRLIQNPYKKQK